MIQTAVFTLALAVLPATLLRADIIYSDFGAGDNQATITLSGDSGADTPGAVIDSDVFSGLMGILGTSSAEIQWIPTQADNPIAVEQ